MACVFCVLASQIISFCLSVYVSHFLPFLKQTNIFKVTPKKVISDEQVSFPVSQKDATSIQGTCAFNCKSHLLTSWLVLSMSCFIEPKFSVAMYLGQCTLQSQRDMTLRIALLIYLYFIGFIHGLCIQYKQISIHEQEYTKLAKKKEQDQQDSQIINF